MIDFAAEEHQARCDLMDALFYVDLVSGRFGSGITEAEKARAEAFYQEMAARYPMQKGRRFTTDTGTVKHD